MTYRPKWKIALELYDRAIGNGLHFDWLTFDEGYGSKPELLRELTTRRQWYVAEYRGALPVGSIRRSSSPGPTTATVADEAVESPAWPVEAHQLGGSMSGWTIRDCGTSRGNVSESRTVRRGQWSGNANE